MRVIPEQDVRARDPLGLTALLPSLWQRNAAHDARGLAQLLEDLVPSAARVEAFSPADCLAATRDLGLVAGSLKRHGVEPVAAVPACEPVFLLLGARTGMVPRDTVHHYITWNPTGPDERRYTGSPTESLLMSAVRLSMPRLTEAVHLCGRLAELDPSELDFALAATELTAALGSLEDAIDIVMDNVTPVFFARTMRPYFEEIRVGGASWLGPAAAHVPLALVDLALWSSDHGDPAYLAFTGEVAQYGLPEWTPLSTRWRRGPSLASRIALALNAAAVPPNVHASAKALCRALRALVAFRGKHVTVAREAYSAEVGLYDLGSGGASVELLEQIVGLTRANAGMVRQAVRSAERGRLREQETVA